MVADATAHIDQDVKDGKLTADQANQRKSNLQDRITKLVNEGKPKGDHGPKLDAAAKALNVSVDDLRSKLKDSVIPKIFLGLVALSFGIWGVGDFIGVGGGLAHHLIHGTDARHGQAARNLLELVFDRGSQRMRLHSGSDNPGQGGRPANQRGDAIRNLAQWNVNHGRGITIES